MRVFDDIKSRIDRVKQTLQPAGGYWPLFLYRNHKDPFLPPESAFPLFALSHSRYDSSYFSFHPSHDDCSTAVQAMPATCLLSADRFLPVPRTIYFPRVPTIYDFFFPSRPALLFSRSFPITRSPNTLPILSRSFFFRPISSSLPSDRVTSFFGRFFRTRNNAPVPGSIPRVHE